MVIDTGIFIEYLRVKDKSKTALAKIADRKQLFISSVTLYELYIGAIDENHIRDIKDLTEDLTLLPFTEEAAIKAAEIYRQLKQKNKLIEFRDIFIAATCVINNLQIATLNKKHFERIEGLQIA